MTPFDDAPSAHAPVILVVDDSETMRQCIILMLETTLTAPRTLQAGDGTEALSVLHDQTPDLIITDLVMPGMDGHQLLAALRLQPRWASLPVLVLSGDGFDEMALLKIDDPHLRALSKPFHLTDLAAMVLQLLALKAAPQG